MKKPSLALLVAALACAPLAVAAETLDFTFSNPNADDSATGQIMGLTPGATASATEVEITGYVQTGSTYTFPIPLQITSIVNNSFTVDDSGVPTALKFSGTGFFGANGSNVFLSLDISPGADVAGLFQEIIPDQGSVIQTGGDFGNVVYTPAGVPEPATWAMLIGGIGLIGAVMRRRASKFGFC